MSRQHADAYVAAELYDYQTANWRTPGSRYANGYLRHRVEGAAMPTLPRFLSPAAAERIRTRLDAELSK